jgi:hypothetical protein
MFLSGGSVRERKGVQMFLYNFSYSYAKADPNIKHPRKKSALRPSLSRRPPGQKIPQVFGKTLNLL